MTRFVVDAGVVLHLASTEAEVSGEHELLGVVPHLVRAGGAAHEAGDVTFDKLALPFGRPQCRAAAKDDEPFLVRVMQVVRPKLLPGIDLVHAPADELGAELRAELGLANPKIVVLHFDDALGGEDVGDLHRRKLP